MYLAAILGLCGLTTPVVVAFVFPAQPAQLSQETSPPPPQNAASTSPSAETAAPGAAPQSESPAHPQTPDAVPEPQKPQPETSAKKPEPQSKTPSKKRRHRKKAATSASTSAPEKKVVRNGGTTDPAIQLAPGVSAEQASTQRQNTTQLLAATDANLKQVSARTMNSSQQDSISQIRKYMEQAKAAEHDGDVQRAHNLASKALLLSDDLVKH